MTKNKRFWSEYYSVGYYTEIIDNYKEFADVPNPKKNLTIEEAVDILNTLYDENEQLKSTIEAIDKLIYDLGSEEMQRQYEEVLELNA